MKALLIIDMLYDFVGNRGALYIGPEAELLIPRVKERLLFFRDQGDPVIHICDRHLPEDPEFEMFPPHCLGEGEGGGIVPELAPLPGERVIYKRRYSAFFGTDLDLTLREKGVAELELAGVATNICILYTAADARMLHYPVTVYASATASFDRDAHQFALQEMAKTLGVTLIED